MLVQNMYEPRERLTLTLCMQEVHCPHNIDTQPELFVPGNRSLSTLDEALQIAMRGSLVDQDGPRRAVVHDLPGDAEK